MDKRIPAYLTLLYIIISAAAAQNSGNDASPLAALMAVMMIFAPFFLIFGSFGAIWLFMLCFIVIAMAVWVLMLVDCIKRKFKTENEKIMWILIIVLTHWIGAVIYYLMVKRKQ